MKLPLNNWAGSLGLLLAATFPQATRAALWKTEEQLVAQFGEPVEIRREIDQRTFHYQTKDLKIRVQFLGGVSQSITLVHDHDSKPFSPEEIESLLRASSDGKTWRRKNENTWELAVPPATATVHSSKGSSYSPDGKETRETRHSLDIETVAFESEQAANLLKPFLPHSRSGAEKRFQGVLEFKVEGDDYKVAIIRDGPSVLEIPWSAPGYPGKGKLEAGKTYEITVRDDELLNMDASVVFVSDRVHKSHEARVHDSEFFVLVRIKHAGEVVFDESVCEVHQTPMQRITAEIEYGMAAADPCNQAYPHHSDWIRGGCIVGDEKTAPLYVCAECVAGCAKQKQDHPDKAAR